MYDSEKRLLKEVAAGNEDAFRQLFDDYHQQLGKYIFRITNSRDLAEEIVQEVFMKIWVNHEALAGIQSIKAYLFVLTRNHTLNSLRKLAKELILRNEWMEYFVRTTTPDNSSGEVYYRLLDEAIDQLPPQQRKVYLLSRHERLKYAEIAAQLDISQETVKSYLRIATASITRYIVSNLEVIVSFLVFLTIF